MYKHYTYGSKKKEIKDKVYRLSQVKRQLLNVKLRESLLLQEKAEIEKDLKDLFQLVGHKE